MNKTSFVNIGIDGFNALERCGIIRWGREFFPDCRVHDVISSSDCDLMDGIVLTKATFLSWAGNIRCDVPVLVLDAQKISVDIDQGHNLTSLDVTSDSSCLEQHIKIWLQNLPSRVIKASSQRGRSRRFSLRETQVISLLKQGASNDKIAFELGIKSTTVKTYLRRIYERLGAENRAHAVSLYKQLE